LFQSARSVCVRKIDFVDDRDKCKTLSKGEVEVCNRLGLYALTGVYQEESYA
jgi:hypothetical protein